MSVDQVDLSIYQFLYNECVSQVGAPTKIPSTWLILAYFSRDASLFWGRPFMLRHTYTVRSMVASDARKINA